MHRHRVMPKPIVSRLWYTSHGILHGKEFRRGFPRKSWEERDDLGRLESSPQSIRIEVRSHRNLFVIPFTIFRFSPVFVLCESDQYPRTRTPVTEVVVIVES